MYLDLFILLHTDPTGWIMAALQASCPRPAISCCRGRPPRSPAPQTARERREKAKKEVKGKGTRKVRGPARSPSSCTSCRDTGTCWRGKRGGFPHPGCFFCCLRPPLRSFFGSLFFLWGSDPLVKRRHRTGGTEASFRRGYVPAPTLALVWRRRTRPYGC